jgi:hypothetical protein
LVEPLTQLRVLRVGVAEVFGLAIMEVKYILNEGK